MKEIRALIAELPDDPDFIPDNSLFRATFFNINPSGDFTESFRLFNLRYESAKGLEASEGNSVITYKYICNKYIEYMNWWSAVYGDKDPKWIGKADKLHDPEGFFDDMLYNKIYLLTKQSKDYYIFGSNSIETLRKKLNIFKERHLKQKIETPIITKQINPKPIPEDDTPF